MMMSLLADVSANATAADGEMRTTLELHPAVPWWLLVPCVLLAVGLVMHLYGQQRKIASRRTILALTAVRVGLVLLMALLLLQPVRKWISTRTSAGTLWVLVDQSPSMQMKDPQAGNVEKLHWAEALGYLSDDVRPEKVDVLSAHLAALSAEFRSLRPALTHAASMAPPGQEAREVRQFVERLKTWADAADALRKRLRKNTTITRDAPVIIETFDAAIAKMRRGITDAGATGSLPDAVAAVKWEDIGPILTRVGRDLAALAESSDASFIAGAKSNSDVQAALSRMTGVPRSELAYLMMTDPHGRGSSEKMRMHDLASKYRVRALGFADTARDAGSVDAGDYADVMRGAFTSTGQATNIGAGLQMVGEQLGPEEAASVVIVTDGRHNVPGDPTEPARALAARGVKVYGLLIGSAEVSPDAAVEQIDAPDWIYREDTLTANALIRMDGLAGKTLRVEFLRGGVLLDTRTLLARTNQQSERVTFTDKPPESAGHEYEIRVAQVPGEVNVQNNRQSFRVAVKKDKLYALVIEDRPRWEFRYVTATLERDPRMKVQTVLLSPGEIAGVTSPPPVKASPANTQIEAQILPETRDEWLAFDLIVLGDIAPATLTPQQQQFIAVAVRDKGATLITIAGQRNMPEKFGDTPLADLLPVTLAPQWAPEIIVRHSRIGFRPALAPEGSVSVLGQFGIDPAGTAALWSAAPLWYWHSPFTQAKPSANVIWSIVDLEGASGDDAAGTLAASRKHALLSTMNVGLGRTLHLASDQTWRFRQMNGQNIQERFWGQVVRWAVGSDLPAGGKYVRFGVSRPRYSEGEPVVVTARVLREDLAPYTGLNFSASARLFPQRDAKGQPIGDSHTVAETRMIEAPESPGYYRGTFGGLPTGELEITLRGTEVERLLDVDPSVTQRSVVIRIEPQLNVEQRNLNTDRAMLARITQAGGGFMLDGPYADVLAGHLPEIQQTRTIARQVGFFTDPKDDGTYWAHWAFMAAFAVLITAEWVIRKMGGLV